MRTLIRPLLALLVSAAAAHAQSEDSAQDARHQRGWAISGEIGVNGLATLFGPVATAYVKPALAVDVGMGVSVSGFRPGLRARYLFTPGDKSTFFAGTAFKVGAGSGGQDIKVKDPDTKAEIRLQSETTYFFDALLGAEFLANNGFLAVFCVGYSVLLNGEPYRITGGAPTDKAIKAFDAIFGSGPMITVSLGKAF